MKHKTGIIITAILVICLLAVVLALVFTHWNTDGKKERRTVPQYTLEELENADITATEATNADSNESAGTTLNNDQWEELAESLFQEIRFWSSHDNISKTEARLSTYDRIELWRKEHKLEKDDITKIFVKTIQDYFLEVEKKSENKKLMMWHRYAISYLGYCPPPQKQFMELVQKTAELEPDYVEMVIYGYINAYPDWIFDDKPIIEIIYKTDSTTYRLSSVCVNSINQILKEKDENRRKRLLHKALEWAFQDDKLEIFHDLDRILLDHCEDYAAHPGRKLQLEKDLKRHEEARNYNWVYRRTKYALEHFGEGDEAFEMLYKMDTDLKLHDGEWERAEREKRLKEGFEEAEKRGIDLSNVLGPELYKKYQSFKASDKK
jgi:hypothetical protein